VDDATLRLVKLMHMWRLCPGYVTMAGQLHTFVD
jgi:hypothetical protein